MFYWVHAPRTRLDLSVKLLPSIYGGSNLRPGAHPEAMLQSIILQATRFTIINQTHWQCYTGALLLFTKLPCCACTIRVRLRGNASCIIKVELLRKSANSSVSLLTCFEN